MAKTIQTLFTWQEVIWLFNVCGHFLFWTLDLRRRYHEISRSFEAVKLLFYIIASTWNWTASRQQRNFDYNSDKPKRRSRGLREPMIRGRIRCLNGPLDTLPKRLDLSSVHHKLLCNNVQGYHFQPNVHCIKTTNHTERICDSYMTHRGSVMDWYSCTALEYLKNRSRTWIIKNRHFNGTGSSHVIRLEASCVFVFTEKGGTYYFTQE